MDKMRAIIFSMIAVAVVVGASISLSYVGLSNATGPENDTGDPVPNNTTISNYSDTFTVLLDPDPPTISDAGLKVEKVIEGLSLPTSMASSINPLISFPSYPSFIRGSCMWSNCS